MKSRKRKTTKTVALMMLVPLLFIFIALFGYYATGKLEQYRIETTLDYILDDEYYCSGCEYEDMYLRFRYYYNQPYSDPPYESDCTVLFDRIRKAEKLWGFKVRHDLSSRHVCSHCHIYNFEESLKYVDLNKSTASHVIRIWREILFGPAAAAE